MNGLHTGHREKKIYPQFLERSVRRILVCLRFIPLYLTKEFCFYVDW